MPLPDPKAAPAPKAKGKAKAAPTPKTQEELDEIKRKRDAAKAILDAKRAAEKEHMEFLGGLFTATPAKLTGVDWSKAERQGLLGGGTSIVRLENKHVICVRRAQQAIAEEFGRNLARIVGVKTMISRAVHPDDPEHAKIEEMAAKTPCFVDDTPMLWDAFITELLEMSPGGLTTETKRPLMKYEYTDPARTMKDLGCSAKAKATIFVEEFLPGAGFDKLCGELAPEIWKDMGKWGALSAITQQENMFPLPVWRESGSLNNIMRPIKDEKTLIALEMGPVPLTGDDLAEYNKRLAQLVREECGIAGEKVDFPKYKVNKGQATTEVKGLLDPAGYEITKKGTDTMMEGFVEGLKAIAYAFDNEEIDRAVTLSLEETAKMVPLDDTAVSAAACAEFVRATAGAVSAAMKTKK